jgi:nucleotide-binding universal stress UspA family protein
MRLLVAFDGSEGARAALREAASLARETGASVVLLQVLNPLLDASDIAAPTTEAAMVTATARAKATLEAALAESGMDAAKAEVVVATTEHGEDYAEAIEREARARGATMIVISSRRAAGLVGALLGSVTDHVIRNAPCPVLVVRE